MLYVGIDVSKLSFDVAILNNGSYQNMQFVNNSEGFKSIEKRHCFWKDVDSFRYHKFNRVDWTLL